MDTGTIKITINNTMNNIYIEIDCSTNILTINGLEKTITNDKIDYLLRIIRLWPKDLYFNNIIDAESYKIEIYYNSKVDCLKGKGKYPSNYQEFKDWIGAIE